MQDEIVSKTKRKKQMLELQSLGEALARLPESQLQSLNLAPELHEAILEAKRIASREAKRRQMQYIGRLMREVDPEPLRAQLAAIAGSSAQAAAHQRRLEAWREKLIADDEALTAFAAAHPGADLQALRSLIRNTRKEQSQGKPPRAYRELFRFIKECSSNPS